MDTLTEPVVDVTSARARACEGIGRYFHAQLEALGEATHPDHPDHNRAVGEALAIALTTRDVEKAVSTYNDWASLHGYEPIKHLATFRHGSGSQVYEVDIKSAVILIDEAGNVCVRTACP
jgi:hypothetical protein